MNIITDPALPSLSGQHYFIVSGTERKSLTQYSSSGKQSITGRMRVSNTPLCQVFYIHSDALTYASSNNLFCNVSSICIIRDIMYVNTNPSLILSIRRSSDIRDRTLQANTAHIPWNPVCLVTLSRGRSGSGWLDLSGPGGLHPVHFACESISPDGGPLTSPRNDNAKLNWTSQGKRSCCCVLFIFFLWQGAGACDQLRANWFINR